MNTVNTTTNTDDSTYHPGETVTTQPLHPATTNDTDQTATISMTARQGGDLADLLDLLDQFLREGPGVADALTAFYRSHRHEQHPRAAALCLIDQVGFTALHLHAQIGANTQEADQ